MAHGIPFHEIPLIGDCWNHKGSCILVSPHLTITVGISSLSFIWVSTRQLVVSSLPKEISSTLSFHESNSTGRIRGGLSRQLEFQIPPPPPPPPKKKNLLSVSLWPIQNFSCRKRLKIKKNRAKVYC